MRIRFRGVRQLSLAATIIIVAVSIGNAQQPVSADTTPLVGWFTGASVGVPGTTSESIPQLFTTALSLLQFRARGPGADLWLGTMPYAFSQGLAAVIVRANLAAPISTRCGGTLLASAGLVTAGAVGDQTVIAIPGVNAGISTLMVLPDIAIRLGVTAHIFVGADRAIWLAEIGFVDLPAARRRTPSTSR
jgi:hypothetical protein